MKSITRFIEGDLKLKVNQDKSRVDRPWNIKFLGFSFYNSGGEYKIRVHEKAIAKFKVKLKNITSRSNGMSMDERLLKLKQVIVGWVNYFGFANMKSLANKLDGWVRRRLRMVIWKSWKRTRTRFVNLQKLGLGKLEAWKYSNTRKGYWKIAGSPILGLTITNDRLKQRGLVSILGTYSKR